MTGYLWVGFGTDLSRGEEQSVCTKWEVQKGTTYRNPKRYKGNFDTKKCDLQKVLAALMILAPANQLLWR